MLFCYVDVKQKKTSIKNTFYDFLQISNGSGKFFDFSSAVVKKASGEFGKEFFECNFHFMHNLRTLKIHISTHHATINLLVINSFIKNMFSSAIQPFFAELINVL
jgi:hypothetical protein